MIRWVDDLGAPAVVTLASIGVDQVKPSLDRPMGIGLSAAGYILGGYMNIGGNFMKNVGIAAAPWAMRSIYEWAKGAGLGGRVNNTRLASVRGRVSRYPGPARDEEFSGVKLD